MSTDFSNALQTPGFQALYSHVPFCVRRCRYCDFGTEAIDRNNPLVSRYLACLGDMAARLGSAGLLASVQTAYLGGGTPTHAGDALVRYAATLQSTCSSQLSEFSTEANPESLTTSLVQALKEVGITRVSLGVQSLNDGELQRLGRAHDARGARAACDAVTQAGLALSCDLMCGIPLQTPESWRRSLEGVQAAGAQHISCYPLILEEGTPLADAVAAGEEQDPSDDDEADYMLIASQVLGDAGYSRYEVASYALPQSPCRHNIAYWTGLPYLGLGSYAASMMDPSTLSQLASALPLVIKDGDKGAPVDAATYLARHTAATRIRLSNIQGPRAFIEAYTRGEALVFEGETLQSREAMAEDLMLGMRMTAGVPADLLHRAVESGIPSARLDAAMAAAIERGLARRTSDGHIVPTEQGWLLGNELYGLCWDLATDC